MHIADSFHHHIDRSGMGFRGLRLALFLTATWMDGSYSHRGSSRCIIMHGGIYGAPQDLENNFRTHREFIAIRMSLTYRYFSGTDWT